MSPRDWQPTSPGAAISDALLDPFPRGRVADRLDLAAPQAGHDQLQALPPPIHVQQGLGLAEDPVAFDGSGHSSDSIARSPPRTFRSLVRPSCREVGTRFVPVRVVRWFSWRNLAIG